MVESDISAPDNSGNSDCPKAYVYAITAREQAIKIGRAIDPAARRDDLQTSHYEFLRVAYAIECGIAEAPAVERQAHILLMDRRLAGEWFDISVDEAKAAIDKALAAVRAGITMLPPRMVRSWPQEDEEDGDVCMVSASEAAEMLDGIPGFISETGLRPSRFYDLAASVIRRNFNLGRRATNLIRYVIQTATENSKLTKIGVSCKDVNRGGVRVESWEVFEAVLELLRHRLIFITSEKDVYRINRKYLSGKKRVEIIRIIERKPEEVDKQKVAAA